jgi:membrane fusion protein, multidrug efflux system
MNQLLMTTRMPLLCCLVVLALAGCGDGQATASVEREDAPAIPVEVAKVARGSVAAFYSSTATLEADREASIVPRLGGTIVELLAEEGERVRAGQVLARIDDDRHRLELARDEATLRRLEQDFNRHREMQARDLISTEAFERAKFEYEAHLAQVQLSRLELSHTAIRAPIDGVVSKRLIKVGNTVNTSEPAFVVTSLDPLLAVLHVPERELARLAVGQPASIAVDALSGSRFQGRIARVSPVIDAGTGTFRATVEVSGEETPLMPGMFARVSIVHDTRENALLVPVQAVIAEDARTSVFVVRDGAAERRDVRTGYRNNGEVEILAGLEQNELVVVTGQAALRTDTRVQVIGAADAPVEGDDGGEALYAGREP